MGKKNDARLKKILREISDLKSELASVQKAVIERPAESKNDGIERACAEYRKLPSDSPEAFRWGFMGAWGMGGSKGAQHSCISVHTTTMDDFMNMVNDEQVCAFASVFSSPHTIAVCKAIFRHGRRATSEKLAEECRLSWEQLDAALAPLQQWNFVRRDGEYWRSSGQGIHFAITLISMATEGQKLKSGEKK